jgi:hypothetical protein
MAVKWLHFAWQCHWKHNIDRNRERQSSYPTRRTNVFLSSLLAKNSLSKADWRKGLSHTDEKKTEKCSYILGNREDGRWIVGYMSKYARVLVLNKDYVSHRWHYILLAKLFFNSVVFITFPRCYLKLLFTTTTENLRSSS